MLKKPRREEEDHEQRSDENVEYQIEQFDDNQLSWDMNYLLFVVWPNHYDKMQQDMYLDRTIEHHNKLS